MTLCTKCQTDYPIILNLKESVLNPNMLYSDMVVCGDCTKLLKREILDILHIFFRSDIPRREIEFINCAKCNGERCRVIIDSGIFRCFDCGITGKLNERSQDGEEVI